LVVHELLADIVHFLQHSFDPHLLIAGEIEFFGDRLQMRFDSQPPLAVVVCWATVANAKINVAPIARKRMRLTVVLLLS
jgi:hypothetical protein